MSTSELIEHSEEAALLRCVEQDSDWYTLAYWPQSRARKPRLMLALHRTTGECHIDWATIEHAADDVTNQARYLAQAMLAIREEALDTHSKADYIQSTMRAR